MVINFSENQDLFKWPGFVPGNKLYATAASERKVNPMNEERNSRQPQKKKTFTIGDSHLTRMNKLKGIKVYFIYFSGANTR